MSKTFDKIETNLKGPKVEETLSPLTAIVGPNRSRKSAIIESVELALTGKHKVGARPDKLDSLAGHGEGPLEIRLSGPGTMSVELIVPRNDKGVPQNAVVSRGADLNAMCDIGESLSKQRYFADLLFKGPRVLRDELFQLYGDVEGLPQPSGLSDEQTRIWKDVAESLKDDDNVTILSKIPSKLYSKKLSLGKSRRVLDSRLAEARKVATGSATEADVARLEAQREDALRAEGAFYSQEHIRELEEQLQEIQDQLTKLESQEAEAREAQTKVERELQSKRVEISQLKRKLAEAERKNATAREAWDRVSQVLSILRKAVEKEATRCPLCRKDAFDPAEAERVYTDVFQSRAEDMRRSRDEQGAIENEIDSLEAEASAAISEAESVVESLQERQASLRRREAEKSAELAKARAAIGPAYTGPRAEELATQIRRAREEVEASKKVEMLYGDIKQLDSERAAVKELEKLAKTFLNSLFERVCEKATEDLNKFMPGDFSLEVTMSEDNSGAQILLRSFDGEMVEVKAGAGSEVTMAQNSLRLAICEEFDFRLLLVDDADLLGLSTESAKAFLAMLADKVAEKRIHQVIVATSDKAIVPEEYTIVRSEGGPSDALLEG